MPLVYAFDHRRKREPRELKALLGGKGANLAEMTTVLDLPVPPGFTITTETCIDYLEHGWPDGLDRELDRHLARLEKEMGKTLGGAEDPLLVSVRSGARISMPGMMDTVLDLGLNDESVEGLAAATDERFARDSYRRFLAMFGDVVLGIDAHEFDRAFEAAKDLSGAGSDHDVPPDVLAMLCRRYQRLIAERAGEEFPQDPRAQLRRAIEAVFDSWNTPRAIAYRRREDISDDLGTAVNVQAMVFGNRDDRSGTGVAFTRDASTGEPGAFGDFLVNAQGEDVVAGIRATLPLAEMAGPFPEAHGELLEILQRLERHYRDMLDVEFTVEQDKLWMLQVRVGKRTGMAALRIALAMTRDRRIRLTQKEAVRRVSADHLEQVLHPQFEQVEHEVIATGLAASPGAAVGRAHFSADAAAEAAARGDRVILVRQETSPEDVHGLAAAEGVLTSRGGLVSHAAVVARGWGKPAVCGADAVHVETDHFTVGPVTVSEGEVISIDGTTGEVVLGEMELTSSELPEEFETILSWADRIRGRTMGVRANADTAEDAATAREHGAEGIGLCRTEHMFLREDRLPAVRRMILAGTREAEEEALAELLEMQRSDFVGILEAMDGLPVTVRLLDPPLHEFLPDIDDLIGRDASGELDDEERELFTAAREWREENPMLGTRGVRLGVLRGGLYRMQARALVEAAVQRVEQGGRPEVQVMIPLVVTERELGLARRWVLDAVGETLEEAGAAVRRRLRISVGSMIETPRAALRADEIAREADFFSLGTNDLTQMTFGFSRDDVEARVMPRYLDEGLLPHNPFEVIDHRGVGELVRSTVELGRRTDPDLEIGVCGEHGGEPASVRFFHDAGVDYVSCSPFRVPIARLAAAHAILDAEG